jgi:hypothetical protein
VFVAGLLFDNNPLGGLPILPVAAFESLFFVSLTNCSIKSINASILRSYFRVDTFV